MLELRVDIVRTGLRSNCPMVRCMETPARPETVGSRVCFGSSSNETNAEGNKRLQILLPVTLKVEPPERRAKIDEADRQNERKIGRLEWFAFCMRMRTLTRYAWAHDRERPGYLDSLDDAADQCGALNLRSASQHPQRASPKAVMFEMHLALDVACQATLHRNARTRG
jgi:hypothetical protein